MRSIELGGATTAVIPDITTKARFNGQKDRPGVLGGLAGSIGAIRIVEDVVLGFGIHTPFGLTTEYDENLIGAFDIGAFGGIRSEPITLAFTPMIAIDLTKTSSSAPGSRSSAMTRS